MLRRNPNGFFIPMVFFITPMVFFTRILAKLSKRRTSVNEVLFMAASKFIPRLARPFPEGEQLFLDSMCQIIEVDGVRRLFLSGSWSHEVAAIAKRFNARGLSVSVGPDWNDITLGFLDEFPEL